MKNLTCITCGSNNFKKNKNNYRCNYCGTSYADETYYSKKRMIFIIFLLSLIIIGGVTGYKLLYSVKKDIKELKKNKKNFINTYEEENPFSDMILKIEENYGKKKEGNTLEKSIRDYHLLEINKAFYLAIEENGKYAFGFFHDAKTIEEAEKKAFNRCKKERIQRNISASCISYAVNNHVSQYLSD